MKNWQENGQTLLIIVLIMVVSLTVGLAVVSRSITSVKTSTEEENSQRAFSAAEAGVEKAIKLNMNFDIGVTPVIADSPVELGSTTKIKNVTITKVSGSSFLVNGSEIVQRDDGADVWLVGHDNNGNPDYFTPWSGTLNIHWGASVCSGTEIAAMEIVVISGTMTTPKTSRYAVEPCDSRRSTNHFSVALEDSGPDVGGINFAYKDSITISSGLLVRIIPLYQDAQIGISVDDPATLPAQGRKIESTGESGGTQRKVIFYQGYPKLPAELFQYSLFCTKSSGDNTSCQ